MSGFSISALVSARNAAATAAFRTKVASSYTVDTPLVVASEPSHAAKRARQSAGRSARSRSLDHGALREHEADARQRDGAGGQFLARRVDDGGRQQRRGARARAAAGREVRARRGGLRRARPRRRRH